MKHVLYRDSRRRAVLRFELDDGTVEEVRPRFGPLLEPTAVEFLLSHLPERVRVVEQPPASWLARSHGNF